MHRSGIVNNIPWGDSGQRLYIRNFVNQTRIADSDWTQVAGAEARVACCVVSPHQLVVFRIAKTKYRYVV